MQSDIATRVAQELGVALGVTESKGLAERPTQNLQAYEAFLRGEEVSGALSVTDPATLRKALALYDQAVALDPVFVKAWAEASIANSLLHANAVPAPELSERARQAAEKAIAIAPDSAEGYLALGTFHRIVFTEQRGCSGCISQGPGHRAGRCDVDPGHRLCRAGLGTPGSGGRDVRQAARLDPRGAGNLFALGRALLHLRRPAEAREAFDRALAVSPSSLVLIENRAMTFLAEGDLPGARASLSASAGHVDPTALVAYLANYQDLGWVLDEPQRDLLLRLTPAAFDSTIPAPGASLSRRSMRSGRTPQACGCTPARRRTRSRSN